MCRARAFTEKCLTMAAMPLNGAAMILSAAFDRPLWPSLPAIRHVPMRLQQPLRLRLPPFPPAVPKGFQYQDCVFDPSPLLVGTFSVDLVFDRKTVFGVWLSVGFRRKYSGLLVAACGCAHQVPPPESPVL